MEPIVEAQKWIVSTLEADSDLDTPVYDDPAPGSASYPFIVIRYMGGASLHTNNAFIVWDDMLFLVEAYTDSGDITAVSPIISKVREDLHAKSGVTSEARIVSCIHEQPTKAGENVEGVNLLRLGGQYRLKVQEL